MIRRNPEVIALAVLALAFVGAPAVREATETLRVELVRTGLDAPGTVALGSVGRALCEGAVAALRTR